MIRANSFDVFDTLIARRCIEPFDIFRAVEVKSGFKNFCQLRIEAERRLTASEYTLDQIYSQFQLDTGVDEQKLAELKELELFEEFENVIPIQENIAKVYDGDLLISDMYLPREIVGMLVSRAGCKRETPVIVTAHGKSRGYIWPILKQHVVIGCHTGDNPHSDISSARAHGISARYTDSSRLNNVETFLKTSGLVQLCKAIRELRLSQHDENPLIQFWTQVQCKYNIPILSLAAFYILNECNRINRDRVLFSSRDCYFLHKIFDGVRNNFQTVTSSYFYTSRLARLSKSEDYARYVRSCLSGKPFIVDLCGTGWSINAMLDNVGVSAPYLLLHDISDNEITKYFLNIRNVSQSHERYYMCKEPNVSNIFIEKLNYVNHGMVIDVKYISELNQYVPVQKPPIYPAEMKTYIKMTEMLIEKFIQILSSYDLNKMYSEALGLGEQMPDIFKAIYCTAALDVKFSTTIDRFHEDDNDDVLAELNASRR